MSFQSGKPNTQKIITLVCILSTHQHSFTISINVDPQQEVYVPDYTKYHNLTNIAAHLHQTSAKYNDFIQIEYGYTSRNQQPQMLTRITNFSYSMGRQEIAAIKDKSANLDTAKVKILLSYGEHAREFFPVESFFHLLSNLTEGLSANAGTHAKNYSQIIFSNFDIFVIVMANPDGRNHVESSYNYCWRGTSTGVDLNRNFDWQFANRGSSGDPKDEEYRGPQPFSEPESKVYVDLTERVKFDAFISFHSGIRHIYMPFADTASKAAKRDPPNFTALSDLSARLSNSTKYTFRYGKAYDLNFYTADGTGFDYMSAVRQIPFSLAVEMWENPEHKEASCFDEFNPDSEHLKEELEAFHPMYAELFSCLLQWKIQQKLAKQPSSKMLNYTLLGVALMLCSIFALKKRLYICITKRRIVHVRRLRSIFMLGKIAR